MTAKASSTLSQPTDKLVERMVAGVLGWSWAGSIGLLLLSTLSWLEFTQLKYGLWVGFVAILLTLTGLGPRYFIADEPPLFSRQTLHKFRLRFERVMGLLLKGAAVYFLFSFLLLFIIGWVAFVPLLAPMYAYDWWKHQDREDSHQVLFEGNWSSIQLRPALPEYGYPSPRPNTFIVRPLSPFVNLVTKLPASQPDNTWRRIRASTPLIRQWQDTLLSESRAHKYIMPTVL